MSLVAIITASAGSGKTTRLARALEQAVVSGDARPGAVLAATFTRKAAAELQERARAALFEAGRPRDAHRMMAARIGTVNAVCGRLVGEYAFELGLSPELRIIDDELAAITQARALSAAISAEARDELTALEARMPQLDWRSSVRTIVGAARENRIGAGELTACARRSADEFVGLLGQPAQGGAEIDAELARALSAFLQAVDLERDTAGDTTRYVRRAKAALAELDAGARPRWCEWIALTKNPGAKSRDAAEPVRRAAADQDHHPALRTDACRAIELVFEAAAATLRDYQERKRRWGAIDFVDQQVHTLELLERDSVRARLRGEIDLVLIDEFQDTSPLQLAIFAELARLAPHSIWVGDPKQAIFGFRGTDPSLMTAAMDRLSAGCDPDGQPARDSFATAGTSETLSTSYRSRPGLVHLTSEIFAAAFAACGLPEHRVRLAPALRDEPEGLGPSVEHWPLALAGRPNNAERADALAAAIRDLLARDGERVRSRETGATRPLRPSDLAVLCRTNDQCATVATALGRLGLRAAVPRTGLLATPEGRVAVAALRLWLDPRDRLAAATVSRFIVHPEHGDAWLRDVLADDGEDSPLWTCEPVRQLRSARDAHASAGVLEVLDRVFDALCLPDLCRAWGEAEARLANLDALRAHAVTYGNRCRARSRPPTTAGFLAHLRDLADDSIDSPRGDHQAVHTADDTVTITTYHRAKGLEWPVAVLYGLENYPEANALGARVIDDRALFDIDDPLGGRWIRFWPTPYWGIPKSSPFTARLHAHPATRRARERADREALRLLYVGWTRARDRLILAAEHGKLLGGLLGKLNALHPGLIESPADDGTATWAGQPIAATIRRSRAAPPVEPSIEPALAPIPRERRTHPPAVVTPSSIDETGTVGRRHRLGDRIPLRGTPDVTRVGEAIHAFLAADICGGRTGDRHALAASLLARWGVSSHLDPEHVVQASDALYRWLDTTWPGAHSYAEWPIRARLPSGTELRGIADLVLELDDGLVIIDHKAFPGTLADAARRARAHAGQVLAYGNAVSQALGLPLRAGFIHLPVSGVAFSVS